MSSRPLELTREQILGHRLTAGGLLHRLPAEPASFRTAAWAGFQDSMPRAAVLSLHARMAGTRHDVWEDPALVQLWGPHHAAYAVAAADRAVFTLGRLPDDDGSRRRADDLADRLERFLDGRRLPYGEAGRGIGVAPNALRYAAPTGRVVIRWDGARAPTIWTVRAPALDPLAARLELARRHLTVYGPTTPEVFGRWSSVGLAGGRRTYAALAPELVPVRTPIGDAWILAADEPPFRPVELDSMHVRFLPSGDALTLLHGPERALLVPDERRRAELWTPRVWPGAVLIGGEVAGTWRRANALVRVQAWRDLSPAERDAVEAEAVSLPLPPGEGAIRVAWDHRSSPAR